MEVGTGYTMEGNLVGEPYSRESHGAAIARGAVSPAMVTRVKSEFPLNQGVFYPYQRQRYLPITKVVLPSILP